MLNTMKIAKNTGKVLRGIGKVLIIISLIINLFGLTCLVISKIEESNHPRYLMRNCYGDTIEVTVEDGEICDYQYGTPLLYCDKCHGVLNGRGHYDWYGLNVCKDCHDYFWDKYNSNN